MLFKPSTVLNLKQGVAICGARAKTAFSIRDFARTCGISINTAYKFWESNSGHPLGQSVFWDGKHYIVKSCNDVDGMKFLWIYNVTEGVK